MVPQIFEKILFEKILSVDIINDVIKITNSMMMMDELLHDIQRMA